MSSSRPRQVKPFGLDSLTRARRRHRTLTLESLEPRTMLTAQPVDLADPSLSSVSGALASSAPSISADGQLIAFASNADNLVPNDTDGTADAFVYNRGTGVVTLISVGSNGQAAGIGGYTSPMAPVISPDGRYVAFENNAGNILPGVRGDQLYLRDLTTGTTSLLTSAATGSGGGDFGSRQPVFSADSHHIAFISDADNLVTGIHFTASAGRDNIFERNLVTNTTALVSIGLDGLEDGNQAAGPFSLSTDGRYVAFQTGATNLVSIATTGTDWTEVYVRDTVTDTTVLVSVGASGQAVGAGHNALDPGAQDISADGRYVVFNSNAANLVLTTSSGVQSYLRDLQSGTTLLLSASAVNGVAVGSNGSEVISPDGRFAAFATATNNVVSLPTNGQFNAYVRNLQTGVLSLASINTASTAGGNAASGIGSTTNNAGGLVFSANGQYLAFQSKATNVTSGVVTANANLYVRDLNAGKTILATPNTATTDGGAGSADTVGSAVFSADGSVIAFEDTAANLVSGDNNTANDVFVRDLAAGVTTLVSARTPLLPALPTSQGGAASGTISSDGNLVVFTSNVVYGTTTSDLAPGVTFNQDDGQSHIFLENRQTGTVSVIDLNSMGTAVGGSDPVISSNGLDVAFLGPTNLLPSGITAGNSHDLNVFVRNLATNTTTLVSVDSTGTNDAPVNGSDLAISANGQYVAWSSTSTLAVAGITAGSSSDQMLFLRDRTAGKTYLVSHDLANDGQVRGRAEDLSLSSDGLYVLFASNDPHLAANDTFNQYDVYRWDRTTGTVGLVSINAAGTGPGNGDSEQGYAPVMSTDGRYIAFTSSATNLVTGGTSYENVFLRDMGNGTSTPVTTVVSLNAAGTGAANQNSFGPSISADGSVVAFTSYATDLTSIPDLNNASDVFARNLTTKTTYLVSINAAGTGTATSASTPASNAPIISPNGRYVAFVSKDDNLVSNYATANNNTYDDYIRDLQEGVTRLVTVSQSGTSGGSSNATGNSVGFSGDSSTFFFGSSALNLYADDRNQQADVFTETTAGYSTISGQVFNDLNANGVNNSDPGLPYWTVYLDTNKNGKLDPGEESVITDLSGDYAFNDLVPGTYTVSIVRSTQAGYTQTLPAAAGSYTVTITTDGQTVSGKDFGEYQALPDLSASTVSVNTSTVAIGQNLTVSWQVNNIGPGAATGGWVDAVYLSTAPTLTSSAVFLTTVSHPGGLAPNASYAGTATVAIPPLATGAEYAIVVTDWRDQIDEGTFGANKANNVAIDATPLNVSITTLTSGTPVTDTFTAPGEGRYYQITVAPGQTLHLALTSAAGSGDQEVYVRRGALPDTSTFDYAARGSGQPNQSIDVPDTTGGVYYVYVRTVYGAASTAGFSLTATLPQFAVTSIGLTSGGNTGRVTIPIDGALLTTNTQATLILGSTVISAASMYFTDASHIFATFDLTGMPTGSYAIDISDGKLTSVLPSAFSVVPGSAGGVQITLGVSSVVRAGGSDGVVVQYINTGNTDAVAPLISLGADHALFYLPDEPNLELATLQFLGISADGPAGILRPGESGQISIPFHSTAAAGQNINYSTSIADDTQPMNWALFKAELQLPHIPNDAWNAIYANLTTNVGTTVGSYHAVLAADATYLSQLGEPTGDVARLLAFEINKAEGTFTSQTLASVTDVDYPAPGLSLTFSREFQQSISGRYTIGPFARGWTDNWQISASADSTGNVSIAENGIFRYFVKQANGSYEGTNGDFATLTLSGGAYRLVETDQSVLAFNADGTLNYEADANSNRITTGYTSGRLTSLTHSDGQSITIHYNAEGVIDQITDPSGRATTYTYDSTGQYLLSYTDKYGKTTYSYMTGQSDLAMNNALTEVAYSDNTHVYYKFDSQGRLTEQYRDNGLEDLKDSYGVAGGYTVTDADQGQTTYLADDMGNIAETIDPLGDVTRYSYNSDQELTQILAPLGASTTYTYDSTGNLTSSTDALGNVVSYAYNSTHDLLSYTDAKGNTTSYGVDGNGNALSITYANGDGSQFQYDPEGNLSETINARGQVLQYTYYPDGQVHVEKFNDGTTDTFFYDTHGNLTQVTDQSGNNTYLKYDSADNLTEIDYPGNMFLQFQYNSVGQRTQSVDQTNFTVNYTYDALGRLSELTDGNKNLIVQYTYDAAGRLSEKDLGNGTYTIYTYDSAGDVLTIVNHALRASPGQAGPVNSEFDYKYDALGEVSTETTSDGQWVYGYDTDSELTQAVFSPNATSSLPAQDLQYSYDAVGNRTQTIINGVTTIYTVNNVNEYTQVGNTTYTYDTDGNLTTSTTGGVKTTYTFDQQNQLTGISSPTDTSSYQYDPFGNQVSSTQNGVTTQNLIDPGGLGNISAQFDGSGNLNAHYTYGLGLVSQITSSGSAAYYDFDLEANTAGITNSTGVYVNRYIYLPFGGTTSVQATLPNPFTFTGQLGATTNGASLISMRARLYDSNSGAFISNDPIGISGGDANVRRYVSNNPTTFVDASGLSESDDNGDQKPPPVEEHPPDSTPPPTENGEGSRSGDAGRDASAEVGFPPPYGSGSGFGGLPPGELFPPSTAPTPPPNVLDPPGFTNPPPNTPPSTNPPPIEPPPPGLPPDPRGIPPVPPPPTPGFNGPSAHSGSPGSIDPNELIGPAGVGTQGYVTGQQVCPYTIGFENDPTKATLAAQDVTITQTLDPNLDWSTFQLGSIQFGATNITIPANQQSYSGSINTTNIDGTPLLVMINAGLNLQTGIVTWTFLSLDPTTGQPPTNIVAGFLPVDDSTGRGQGYVHYTIATKTGLATNTAIQAQASVVFDTNAALATNTSINTIDVTPPSSTVAALPATTHSEAFLVSWSGTDAGSGIGGYNVYVSDNGGVYTLFQTGTTATSASFLGTNGHTYKFYSVATDNVGNVQPTPSSAQAVTTLNVTEVPPGNYLGNGLTVPALFRRTNAGLAQWFIKGLPTLSGDNFGAGSLDVPITGDFDGDGKTDIAVYRPSTAQWFVQESGSNYAGKLLATFGAANVDVPVPANYNGTGTTVPAVYRPTTGQWFVYEGGNGHNITEPVTFPIGSDPVPGNYDNFGKDEAAVYNPKTSQWLVESPGATNTHVVATFGGPNDIPVPGDYDALATGNGTIEPAVWRPSTGQFFIRDANTGKSRMLQFEVGDIPAPGDYDGIGETEAAVYRPTTGQWLVEGPNDTSPRVFATYGGPSDVPTVAPYPYRALKSGGGLISAFSVGNSVSVDLGATAQAFASGSSTQSSSTTSPASTIAPLASAKSTGALGIWRHPVRAMVHTSMLKTHPLKHRNLGQERASRHCR